MKKSLRMLELIAVALALFSAIGCGKLRARDQLNKGVQSYKNGKYEDAIDHFQRAVSFDSGLIVARLYLATAYAHSTFPAPILRTITKWPSKPLKNISTSLRGTQGRNRRSTALRASPICICR